MDKKNSYTNHSPIDQKRENDVEKAHAGNDASSDDLNPQQKRYRSIRRSLAMGWVGLQAFFNRLYERALHLLEEIKFLNRQKSDSQEQEAQMVPMTQGVGEEHGDKAVTTDTFQQHLSRSLKKLYKKPVKSASGKTVKVSVDVNKDNDETPFEPILQSMGDELTSDSTTQYSSLHFRQRDLNSNNVQDLGDFRVSHRNNSPEGITGLQIKGIKPEDLESTTPWEDLRIDQYSRAFEVMGASNEEFRLKIKDVNKISVEARKGLGTALENAEVGAHRVTFESPFGRYKLDKDRNALVSEPWTSDAQEIRDNPTSIRNLDGQCAISLTDVKDLKNPVMASDGNIYDKEAITQWLSQNNTHGQSPLTREKLEGLLTVEETQQLMETAKNNMQKAKEAAENEAMAQEDPKADTLSENVNRQNETSEQREQLRAQQDKAYQESLKADMAKRAENKKTDQPVQEWRKDQRSPRPTPSDSNAPNDIPENSRQLYHTSTSPSPPRTEIKNSNDSELRRLKRLEAAEKGLHDAQTSQAEQQVVTTDQTSPISSSESQPKISKEEVRQKRLDAIAETQKDLLSQSQSQSQSHSAPHPTPTSSSQSSQSATPAKGSSSKQAAPSVEMPGKGYRMKEPTMMEKAEDAFFGQDARFDKERNAYYQNYSPNKPEEIAAESKAIEITPTTNALPERQEWVDQQQAVLDGLNKDKRAASSLEPSSPQPKPSPGLPNHGKDIDDDLPRQNATALTDTLSPRPVFTGKGPTEKEMADVALMARPESPTKEFPPTIPRLVE